MITSETAIITLDEIILELSGLTSKLIKGKGTILIKDVSNIPDEDEFDLETHIINEMIGNLIGEYVSSLGLSYQGDCIAEKFAFDCPHKNIIIHIDYETEYRGNSSYLIDINYDTEYDDYDSLEDVKIPQTIGDLKDDIAHVADEIVYHIIEYERLEKKIEKLHWHKARLTALFEDEEELDDDGLDGLFE